MVYWGEISRLQPYDTCIYTVYDYIFTCGKDNVFSWPKMGPFDITGTMTEATNG